MQEIPQSQRSTLRNNILFDTSNNFKKVLRYIDVDEE